VRTLCDTFSRQCTRCYPSRRSSDLLVCASTVLIGHHTSGVRREFYRDETDLEKHRAKDPGILLKNHLIHDEGFDEKNLDEIEIRSEEHTSELQSRENLVCRLLLEKK